MSRQGWRLVLSVLSGVWFAAVVGAGYTQLAPVWVKKNVTITIKDKGQVKFVFSAAEPDNEVIYTMKTHWTPLLEASPMTYVGQVIDTPYQDFKQRALLRTVPVHVALGLLPVLLSFGLRNYPKRYK